MGKEDKEDDGNTFGVSRKIMLVAIFSLFTLVIFIVFLHLYSRYLNRRREMRRRATFYRIHRQVVPGESIPGPERPDQGLDSAVIASLPKLSYKPTQHQLDHDDPVECSVCLGAILEDATLRVLPNCKHVFHVECIDEWLGSHTTCPICRTMVEPRVQTVEGELAGGEVQPSAPPLEENSTHGGPQSEKDGGSGSRLDSFRRMITRERSSRGRSCGDGIFAEDLERQ